MAKKRLAGLILSCLVASTGWAATSSPSLIATPPQPNWSELTIPQKIVLAPLSDDWDSLEYYRQKKWLHIAKRFPTMAPEEQRRIQGQMQEWGKLTSAQRQLARENFITVNQLSSEKKQKLKQKWEEYSSLPEDEKAKLKQQATGNPVPKPGRPTMGTPQEPSPSAQPTPPANPSLLSADSRPAGEAAPPANSAPATADTATKP